MNLKLDKKKFYDENFNSLGNLFSKWVRKGSNKVGRNNEKLRKIVAWGK